MQPDDVNLISRQLIQFQYFVGGSIVFLVKMRQSNRRSLSAGAASYQPGFATRLVGAKPETDSAYKQRPTGEQVTPAHNHPIAGSNPAVPIEDDGQRQAGLAISEGRLGSLSSVYALALDSFGNLYVGGTFTIAGGTSANNIAKWNGSTWSALGSGMDYPLNSIVFDSSDNLYAGGNFTTAGDTTANKIAKWNGSTWSALGLGMNSDMYTLAFDKLGNLYAGGSFTTAGGATANHIAKWK